jgi:hypothetical protein
MASWSLLEKGSIVTEHSSLTASGQQLMSRAWYAALVDDFVHEAPASIVGKRTSKSAFAVTPEQRDAWLAEVVTLKSALHGIDGTILLEFTIPRMGRRADAVILSRSVVMVVEFKVGSTSFDRDAIEQVWDYALDLKYFHRASHTAPVVPILVASEAPTSEALELVGDRDGVYRPLRLAPTDLGAVLRATVISVDGKVIDAAEWLASPYLPTPTIVEAARALYARHSVEEIARSDAGATNLRVTSRRIEALVDEAKATGQKMICFVTGVPGAGKTLVGLNVATQRRQEDSPTHAVFLSGNGPLVAVLRESLIRDEVGRRRNEGDRVRKGVVGKSVQAFIQNVHHFRDDALSDAAPPAEHVAIFDEAQRAWNLTQTANFMKRRKHQANFDRSEPEFLLEYMDRHPDWAAVICLVGGGQEINTGEAGIGAWIEAVERRCPHWIMYISPRLADTEYQASQALGATRSSITPRLDERLHLSVSLRSFRAERLSDFVKALLDCEREKARELLAGLADRYPVAITRNIQTARRWVRERARGSERFGLVASSKAMRLKPHAIDIRVAIDPVHWFLDGRDDTRSSYYLEDAATEFQVQGLELDWSCVTWDGDLRFAGSEWAFHDFRGSRWQRILNSENRNYLRNAYRVLLTRARQGMVIFVPEGDREDYTRQPEYYDETYSYLLSLGIASVD